MATELQPLPRPVGGRVPPHNIEAEQSVLGGVLLDNSALPKAVESLKTGEEFYKPAHKVIYASFLELFNMGEPIDLMTVTDRLRKRKQIDEAGGLDYLAGLVELVPTAANVGFHAKIVKEKSLLRRLIATAGDLVNLGFEDTEAVDSVIERAEKMIFDLAEDRIQKGFSNIKEVVNATIHNLEELFEKKELITGLPTGYHRFDEKTAGLQPGDLVIMAGRPSMGKTAICINVAEFLAVEHEKVVAFFSLEMSAMQLVLRMISSLSRLSMQKIRTGYLPDSDWGNITRAAQQLYETNLFIDDQANQTALDIRSKCRRLKAEKGLDLVIIDYLQLMSSQGRAESRVLEISEITRSLKGLARELNVPIIVISQLSRKVEERPNRRPTLSDLRESGSIEQDADLVCFVYREEYYHPEKPEIQGLAEVIIGKQRNGPVGIVPLAFNKECTRFDNLADMTPDVEGVYVDA